MISSGKKALSLICIRRLQGPKRSPDYHKLYIILSEGLKSVYYQYALYINKEQALE